MPVTFAMVDNAIVIAVDHKPKTTANPKRLRNIAANDQVSLLVDHYDDRDWSELWWIRADGVARVLETEADRLAPVAKLVEKYSQYRETVPAGPVIRVVVHTWRGWAYSG